MNLVPYAVPFFVLLIAMELAWGWYKSVNTYRINDSINSLMLGVLSTSTKLVALDVGGRVFSTIADGTPGWRWDVHSPWAWLGGLLLYDFCYYWFHRISHERQIFWASHVAHHQSEEFNLTTALRQTSTSFLLAWVFYLPCFLLGMPVEMFVTIASAHLIYQFWIHTRHIPKLGPFEWVFVSPSNHRVHHGINDEYIDKNHGGLLIIWDRLFGTFEEEKAPVVYGVRRALQSWNPLWANLQIYWHMILDTWHTAARKDKWRIWWSRTGWRPADVQERYPLPRCDPAEQVKYDANPGSKASWYILAHFTLVIPLISVYELYLDQLPLTYAWVYVLLLCYTFYTMAMTLEGRSSAGALELVRWVAVAIVLVFSTPLLDRGLAIASWCYLVASILLMVLALRSSQTVSAQAATSQHAGNTTDATARIS